MYQITEEHIKERDIDWFCLINNYPCHIASMGGMIPNRFLDIEKLRYQQNRVARIEPSFEVGLHLNVIQSQVMEGYGYLQDEMIRDIVVDANRNNPGFKYLNDYSLPIRLYASTFVEMARRGFYSFARIAGNKDNRYALIAEPCNPLNGDELRRLYLDELKYELYDDGDSIIIVQDPIISY